MKNYAYPYMKAILKRLLDLDMLKPDEYHEACRILLKKKAPNPPKGLAKKTIKSNVYSSQIIKEEDIK